MKTPKKSQTETVEIKNMVPKQRIQGVGLRTDWTKERISELENISVEILSIEAGGEKCMGKKAEGESNMK